MGGKGKDARVSAVGESQTLVSAGISNEKVMVRHGMMMYPAGPYLETFNYLF